VRGAEAAVSVRRVIHKDRLRRWLHDRARGAGAREPNALSRDLMLVFAGTQSQALIEHSGSAARDARRLAVTLIDGAIAS